MSGTASLAGGFERATGAVEEQLHKIADRPDVRRTARVAGYAGAAVILAVFAFGTVMVATMVRWSYVATGVLLLAGFPWLVDRLAKGRPWPRRLAVGVSTVVVSVVSLLGVNVLWASAELPRPSAGAGLALAGGVVLGVAYAYLRWTGKEAPPHHGRWATSGSLSALAFVVLTSGDLPGIGLVAVAAAAGVAVWLYLRRPVGPDIRRALSWALLLVGVAIVALPLLVEAIKGGRLSPILLLAGALIAAIAAINGLWLRDSPEGPSLARWAAGTAVAAVVIPCVIVAFLQVTSTAPATLRDDPVAEAAVTGAVPQAAVDHRPILRFDTDERFRTPLDADAMLRTELVELCPEGTGLLAECRTLTSAADLRNGFGNLRFNSLQIQDEMQDGDLTTTIYAHTVAWQNRLYIDYWWYLPDNPADTARGAMCGAGLVIPEITCFDHQSDWEGVTVVVDRNQEPIAVHYAAHSHVIKVPWTTLQQALKGKAMERFAHHPDAAQRPFVFVARGTHAAYPLPCKSSVCRGQKVFEDNRHDGRREWPEDSCSVRGCVSGFPRTAGDARDASWNAFDGHWGSAVCFVKIYCARSKAPRAPGTQPRYKQPWCYDFEVKRNLRSPHRAKPPHRSCR